KLRFNREPFGLQLEVDSSVQQYFYEGVPATAAMKDTAYFWFDTEENFNLILYDTLGLRDTVRVKPPPRAAFVENRKLKMQKLETGTIASQLLPGRSLRMLFSHPLSAFDTAGIQLLRDTLPDIIRPQVSISTDNSRTLLIEHNWKPTASYKLRIDAGAVTDWYGLTSDTLRNEFKIPDTKELGILNIQLSQLDSTLSYTLDVLNKNNKLVASYVLQDQSTFQTTLKNLPPGVYTIKMIEDRNGNGRWDPGNYDRRLQPERRFEKALEELRGNWEVEAVVEPVFN
ncbi:MAG: DUF2141 domain-containing protein, partial [Bacteroidota bacterium]